MNRRIVTIGHTQEGYYFFGIQPPLRWEELKKIQNPATNDTSNRLTMRAVVHDSAQLQVIGFEEDVPASDEQAQNFARDLAKSIGAKALTQILTISHEKELFRD